MDTCNHCRNPLDDDELGNVYCSACEVVSHLIEVFYANDTTIYRKVRQP